MSRAQLVAMAKRNLAHVKAKTVDRADGVYRVPATNYYDPERWRLEMDRIFKRLPLVLGFSVELREPGDYRSLLVADHIRLFGPLSQASLSLDLWRSVELLAHVATSEQASTGIRASVIRRLERIE